tara:strand:+ start:22598 stop:23563 length:966 start_codon:yes stop_codon:yes gene_type:complete
MANGYIGSASQNQFLLENVPELMGGQNQISIVDALKSKNMPSGMEDRRNLYDMLTSSPQKPEMPMNNMLSEELKLQFSPMEADRIVDEPTLAQAGDFDSSTLPSLPLKNQLKNKVGSLMDQFAESKLGKLTKSMGGVANIASTGLQIYNMLQQKDALKEAKTGIEGAMGGLDSLRADTVSSEVEAIENLEKEMKSTIGNRATTLRGSLKSGLDKIPRSNIQTGSIQEMADNARNTIQNALDAVVDQAKSRFDSGRSYEDQKTRDALGRIESTRTQLASELDKIEQARKQLPIDMAMKGIGLLGPQGKAVSSLYDIGKGFRT